jgi:hemoglobin/transferrin/lactoferrin receptor protein
MNSYVNKFLLLLILFFSTSYPQTNTLTGKIIDNYNGSQVQGAVVFISYNYMAYSDNEGNYFINDLPDGSYIIKVSRLGYHAVTDTIIKKNNLTRKDFRLELSPVELDEVIVWTDRTANYLRNSAYSELLIGAEEIQSKPFYSIPDAMKYEPGISLLRDGVWGTEVNIRGLSRENVITLIDGSRIVTSTDIAARFSLVDQNDVERIEVIKGAASSIYGSGATGGIVNIITRSPFFSSRYYLNGSISGGYNSVNNSYLTSGIFYTGSERWAAKFAASYRNADNIQTPAGELNNSQFEDYSLSGSLGIKPFHNHNIRINYQKFKAEDVGIPGGSVFPGNATVRYPDEERELISASYEVLNISRMLYKLSAKYAYQFILRDVENIPHIVRNVPAQGTTPARRISVLKITPGAEHRNNNFDLQGNMLLAEDNNLVFGLDYWDRSYLGHRENYQQIEVLNAEGNVVAVNNRILGEKPLPDAKSRNIGVYLQDEAALVKNKLALSLGVRADRILITGEETRNPVYEYINGVLNPNLKDSLIWNKIETTDYSYSSNLGLRYSLNSNLDFTFSLGLSFRSPSLEERFQFIDQGSFIRLGNPELKSEYGRAIDLGIRYYLPGLKIVSSIFYNYFTDLVVEEPGTFEERPAFIKTNVGHARLYGFDFSTEYNFYNSFVFYTTASYVKGDDITYNDNLPGIPPLNGNIGLRTGILNEIEVDFSTTVFNEQRDIARGETITPGYAVFNLSLNTRLFSFPFMSLQLYSGIENIFDKSYRNHLSTTRGFMTLEPGRNIYFRLVTKF